MKDPATIHRRDALRRIQRLGDTAPLQKRKSGAVNIDDALVLALL